MKIVKIKKKKRMRVKEIETKSEEKYVQLKQFDDRISIETKQVKAITETVMGFVGQLEDGGVETGWIRENAELIKAVFFDAAERYLNERRKEEEARAKAEEENEDGESKEKDKSEDE